jgi:hypothetical protein
LTPSDNETETEHESFMFECPIDSTKYEFTHEKLDLYCIENVKENYKEDHLHDYLYLEFLDRAFW